MSDKGNLFAIGDGRGDYHFRLYNSESDGLFYIELGAHLAGKSDYESMTTIRVVLQEFYKWMVFWGYRTDTPINPRDYSEGNIWTRRGFESIETAFAIFKTYAVEYISGLPEDEFALTMDYFDGALEDKMQQISDPELKDMLMEVKDAYVDFAIGMLGEAHHSIEKREALMKYILENPEASSSDILQAWLLGTVKIEHK